MMHRGCCIPEPARIPLTLGLSDPDVPKEFSEAVNVLKSATNQHLFRWRDFPVELPSSVLDITNVSLANIFSAPEFDECEMLAKDAQGNSKPLNRHQLIQLRRTAEFDVDSMNFIGEVHTWKVSPFFLKGTDNIRKTLLEDLQNALAQLVIHAHDRVVSKQFSIVGALSAGYRDCFRRLIDLLFGWPCVNHGDVDRKLMEERLRFLTCELSVKSSQRKRVMEFWDTYEQFMRVPRDAPVDQIEMKHPPYRFVTPARIPIDLRLHNSVLLDRCLAIIHELRQPARSGWFQDFKEHAISRFRDEGKSIPEIKRLVRQDALREYASRLFDAIRQNNSLQSISQGIAEPLIQQATFSLILAEAKESFIHSWLGHQEAAEHELRRKHPVLYHIEEWRLRQLNRIQQQYLETHKFDVHEFVLAKCVSAGLEQHAFFVRRDLLFLRDRERLLRDQLEKSSSFPDTQFIFRVPAQLLRHWRVYRKHVSYTTNYELIDTVLLSRRPSSTDPIVPVKRSIKRVVTAPATKSTFASHGTAFEEAYSRKTPKPDHEIGPQDFEVHADNSPKRSFRQSDVQMVVVPDMDSQPLVNEEDTRTELHRQSEYVVQSSLIYKASTRYFMWRWLAFFVCTYSWFLRLGQLFFITIPFRSALSFTALFKPTPIYLKLEIDQSTGYLFYNKTFYQDTVISRLRRLWSDIRASRIAFDATPSRGMLDKAAARPLHRIWSYVFRGLLVSVLLLLFWPPACLVVSSLSLLVGLCLPVLVPFASLTLHLLGLLFWDAYKPAFQRNRLFPLFELVFVHFLIRFLFQLCLATLVTVVVCPLLAVAKFFWAIIRYCLRSTWDGLVYHLVIRRLARIPAREDFMVKRTSGPGTAENHFYQARPVDILVILVGQLELLELRLWRRQMESMAEKPLEAYKKLAQSLSWLSLAPQLDGEVYRELCRQTKLWRSAISAKSDERNQALQLDLKPKQSHRIKLSDRDLRLALRMGAELTESFYHSRIAARLQLLNQSPAIWWSTFALADEDFLGLCTSLLGQTFGEQLFTCIMETDTVFPIQVREPDLTRKFQDFLVQMVTHQTSHSSLDQLSTPAHSDPLINQTKTHLFSESEAKTRGVIDGEEAEALSVTSEVNVSTSDIFSQRCTVIAVSPSKRRAMKTGADSAVDVDSALNTSSDRAVSFVFPERLHSTQRRPVPDPIAFIHIDLPLFPLSAFAPATSRHLPLPLRSAPKPSSDVHLPCCLNPARIERTCACCICPSKASLERQSRVKLAARWSSLAQATCGGAAVEDTCAEHAREDLIYPVCSGLTTLLAEEERDLRRQFTTCNTMDTRGGRRTRFTHAQEPTDWPLESASRCRCTGRLTSPRSPMSLWQTLFGPPPAVCVESRRSPVATVVEHLGRVYHPAIIMLLMHARDREHNPLDFTHPALQASINMITTPQKEFNLLHRLRQNATGRPAPPLNGPTQLAISMGSELAQEPNNTHSEKSNYPKFRSDRGSDRLLRRKQVLSECLMHDSGSTLNESGRRPLSLWGGEVHVPIEPSSNLLTSARAPIPKSEVGTAMSQQQAAGPARQMPKMHESHSGFPTLSQMDQQMLFGWDDANALVAGYWSGMETPHNDFNGPGYSVGTPSVSLYGTEDAATTDDLDETEDAASLSSMDQCDYMENFLAVTASHEQSNRTLFIPDRPQNFPLAVPELLTTSATTAGSNEPESLMENEMNVAFLQSHRELNSSRLQSPAASTTLLDSGATSIAVTPCSCEMLRVPSLDASSESPLNATASQSPVLSPPDILAGMPGSQTPSRSTEHLDGDHEFGRSMEISGQLYTPSMPPSVPKADEVTNAEIEEDDTLKAVVII